MQTLHDSLPPKSRVEDERWEALSRCHKLLAREGFTVSWVWPPPKQNGVRPPDLIATNGYRIVRVFVLLEKEVDAASTKNSISASLREGETRVYVPWPLRWRAISNLDRWAVDGVAVAGW